MRRSSDGEARTVRLAGVPGVVEALVEQLAGGEDSVDSGVYVSADLSGRTIMVEWASR